MLLHQSILTLYDISIYKLSVRRFYSKIHLLGVVDLKTKSPPRLVSQTSRIICARGGSVK